MHEDVTGQFQSPGGFIFGVQGWTWGEPRPTSITFFLDGTAKVSDQHGRPIKGTVVDGKQVLFAQTAPENDPAPGVREKYASHADVIEALAAERVDWLKLNCAGWPQLPYADLMKLPIKVLPPCATTLTERESFLGELRKIKDPDLRKDAIRARREMDELKAKELAAVAEE